MSSEEIPFRIATDQQSPFSFAPKHKDSDWMLCTMCRSMKQSQQLLEKATRRKVDWPQPKQYSESPVQDTLVHTSIDDAFATIMQYMSTTSRQCKRFYQSCSQSQLDKNDSLHCGKFHTPLYAQIQHRNPLDSAEDVHMVVHPGSYAVTAGEWGTKRQQTHVVHVNPGQSVNLDFVM